MWREPLFTSLYRAPKRARSIRAVCLLLQKDQPHSTWLSLQEKPHATKLAPRHLQGNGSSIPAAMAIEAVGGDAERCALVLGGGGPLGLAWQAAMLQGWSERWAQDGPRNPLAPLLSGRIIGTSAGAIVGAHLAAHDCVTAMVAEQHEPLGPDARRTRRWCALWRRC